MIRSAQKYFLFLTLLGVLLLSACHNKKKITEKEDKKEEKKENVNAEYKLYMEKYALQMGVKAEDLSNGYLYQFIDGWIGVPYKWAGNDKNGVDCSGFVNQVFLNVYKKQLERSAKDIINECDVIDKDDLKEGDLVFFDISGANSHIGVYLINNKFVHASSSKGVMISDLTQTYWTKYWGRAGRVKGN